MSRIILPPKVFGEVKTQVFDFLSLLGIAETISTAVTVATVYSGVDATPANVISGAASIAGSQVSQKLADGVAGVTYQLVCTVTTSAGQTLKLNGYLVIESSLP